LRTIHPARIRLCGLVPLVDQSIYGLPAKAIGTWKHDFCFDSTPLISKPCFSEVIEEIVRFLAAEKYSLLRLSPLVAGEELKRSLNDIIAPFGGSAFVVNLFHRAAFEPANDVDQYRLDNLSKKFKQKSQRLARRLAEEGDIVYESADDSSEFLTLAQQFIDLEQSGWKGKNGTALGSQQSSKNFYLDCIERLSLEGQARFLTLKLDDKPIAMISTMASRSNGSNVQAFKTTFDESYSAYSPGVAIEIHNLEIMHNDGITFADSCAATSESAMNRIWGQKVSVQNIIVPLRRGMPTILAKLLPLLKKLSQYRSPKP